MTTLGQQYIIDASFRVDRDVAENIRRTQKDRRAVLPEEIQLAIKRNLQPGEELGKIIMSNKDFVGSWQWCQLKYQDAICIAMNFKKVRFLVTATANPKWPELTRSMNDDISTNPIDYADLFNRLFIDKDERLKREMIESDLLGKHIAHARSIEFQKRGISNYFVCFFSITKCYAFNLGGAHSHHIHICDIPFDTLTCDQFISAELPDLPSSNDQSKWAQEQRRYYNLVIKYMLHICSNVSGCWNGRKCGKGFPKQFLRHTIIHDDKPTEYRRRSPVDGGNTYTNPKTGVTYDNRHVVPLNRYLLLRWGGHINVEWVKIKFYISDRIDTIYRRFFSINFSMPLLDFI